MKSYCHFYFRGITLNRVQEINRKKTCSHFFPFILMKNVNFFVYITALIELYYMACVCSRYNTNSDWLNVTDLWGIILP